MTTKKPASTKYAGIDRRSRVQERWHFSKEISITVLGFLMVQTVATVWFFSHLSFSVDQALAAVSEYKTERYTREDARRDLLFTDQRFQAQKIVDSDLDRRIVQIEGRMDRMERK